MIQELDCIQPGFPRWIDRNGMMRACCPCNTRVAVPRVRDSAAVVVEPERQGTGITDDLEPITISTRKGIDPHEAVRRKVALRLKMERPPWI